MKAKSVFTILLALVMLVTVASTGLPQASAFPAAISLSLGETSALTRSYIPGISLETLVESQLGQPGLPRNQAIHYALSVLKLVRFLHQLLDVGSLIEGTGRYFAGILDELPCQVFLSDNLGVIFDVSSRTDVFGEGRNIIGTTHLFEYTVGCQLVGDGQNIDRILLESQFLNRRIDQLVIELVECFRFQQFAHLRVGIFLEHQGT